MGDGLRGHLTSGDVGRRGTSQVDNDLRGPFTSGDVGGRGSSQADDGLRGPLTSRDVGGRGSSQLDDGSRRIEIYYVWQHVTCSTGVVGVGLINHKFYLEHPMPTNDQFNNMI